MTIDASGTCHQVGCPGKGQHPPHGIGAGTWDDYQEQHCLGFPYVLPHQSGDHLTVVCSLSGSVGFDRKSNTLDPVGMAELVDQHKAECTNRTARPTPTTGASA